MREAVRELCKLGPFPSYGDEGDNVDRLKKVDELIRSISRPVSDDEARALVGLFGEDDCYGLVWTLVHLIETSPGWPLEDCLANEGNEWVSMLRQRVENGRKLASTGEI